MPKNSVTITTRELIQARKEATIELSEIPASPTSASADTAEKIKVLLTYADCLYNAAVLIIESSAFSAFGMAAVYFSRAAALYKGIAKQVKTPATKKFLDAEHKDCKQEIDKLAKFKIDKGIFFKPFLSQSEIAADLEKMRQASAKAVTNKT